MVPSLTVAVLGATLWMATPAASPSAQACPAPLPMPAPGAAPSAQSPPTSAQPATGQIVACVGSQPITESVFLHWKQVAKRAQRHARPRALIEQAMGFLISSDWVIGEASELNVRVSEAAVRRQFDRI